jgi:hypothetical protein
MSETGDESVLNETWERSEPILVKWQEDLEKRMTAHRRAADKLRFWNRVLGGLNVVLAAITATTVFAALNEKFQGLSPPKQILITAIAVLPAVSAGLQKEWQLASREQNHVLRIHDYRSLVKQLDFIMAQRPADPRVNIKSWIDSYDAVMAKLPPGHQL